MTARSIRVGVIVLGAVLLLGACRMPGARSPAMRYWLLEPVAGSRAETAEQTVVSVGPIFFPAYLKRSQYVDRASDRRLRVYAFDRWAAPLDVSFAEVLSRNLELLIPGLTARDHREMGRDGFDYAVEISVTHFEVIGGSSAVLGARWKIVRMPGGEIVARGQRTREVPVSVKGSVDPGVDAGVEALSRALAELATEIAAALANLESPVAVEGSEEREGAS